MEIFPNWTVVPIVLFLAILTYVLNRTFFRPMGRTLAERDRRIEGARREAEEIRRTSKAKLEEFETKLREARRESDIQMAQIRTLAMDEKNRVLSETRGRADEMLSAAREEIRNSSGQAEKQLRDHAEDFARRIAARILNRPLRKFHQPDLPVRS